MVITNIMKLIIMNHTIKNKHKEKKNESQIQHQKIYG